MRLSINQNTKAQTRKSYDMILLLSCTLLGCWLRFLNLTAKPPWTDEFATMVFSLGNSYDSVLLNQILSIEGLLQPLKLNPDATIFDVISLLLHEDNHPPLYFVLAHWWMKLFPSNGEYISIWAARSLPALFGGLSIPASYFLGRIAFQSRVVGHLSAIMMAVSPYGVFIAQEARHYTLAILFVIFSLCCLIIATKHIEKETLIPIPLVFLWLIINCVGLAVHYFFSLTLCAQAITLIFFVYKHFKTSLPLYSKPSLLIKNCWRLGLVVIGTITTGIIWILLLVPNDYGNGMTEWIRQDNFNFLSLISPVFQLMAAWITMIALLPIESSSLPIVIISGLLMLFFFIWAIPKLIWGLRVIRKQENSRLGLWILLGFIISSITLFFSITYFCGLDITRGARYSFVYFPAVPVIWGASLAVFWRKSFLSFMLSKRQIEKFSEINIFFYKRQITILIIILMGFISAITINFNLGYKKYYLPNQLIEVIKNNSSNQVLIATTHESLVQTGEMMGIAWELQKNPLPLEIKFFLAHKALKDPKSATRTLENTFNKLTRPLDIWTVNFKASIELNECIADSQTFPHINGYDYQRYQCK